MTTVYINDVGMVDGDDGVADGVGGGDTAGGVSTLATTTCVTQLVTGRSPTVVPRVGLAVTRTAVAVMTLLTTRCSLTVVVVARLHWRWYRLCR